VEGASGLDRGIAQLLVAAGESVVDVLAKLAARARRLAPAAPARATWPTPARSRWRPSITATAPGRPREQLQAVCDALGRALPTMDQIERRSTVPDGTSGWDYGDQKAVHEQLAASVRGPAGIWSPTWCRSFRCSKTAA
jgi:hypothetical protein